LTADRSVVGTPETHKFITSGNGGIQTETDSRVQAELVEKELASLNSEIAILTSDNIKLHDEILRLRQQLSDKDDVSGSVAKTVFSSTDINEERIERLEDENASLKRQLFGRISDLETVTAHVRNNSLPVHKGRSKLTKSRSLDSAYEDCFITDLCHRSEMCNHKDKSLNGYLKKHETEMQKINTDIQNLTCAGKSFDHTCIESQEIENNVCYKCDANLRLNKTVGTIVSLIEACSPRIYEKCISSIAKTMQSAKLIESCSRAETVRNVLRCSSRAAAHSHSDGNEPRNFAHPVFPGKNNYTRSDEKGRQGKLNASCSPVARTAGLDCRQCLLVIETAFSALVQCCVGNMETGTMDTGSEKPDVMVSPEVVAGTSDDIDHSDTFGDSDGQISITGIEYVAQSDIGDNNSDNSVLVTEEKECPIVTRAESEEIEKTQINSEMQLNDQIAQSNENKTGLNRSDNEIQVPSGDKLSECSEKKHILLSSSDKKEFEITVEPWQYSTQSESTSQTEGADAVAPTEELCDVTEEEATQDRDPSCAVLKSYKIMLTEKADKSKSGRIVIKSGVENKVISDLDAELVYSSPSDKTNVPGDKDLVFENPVEEEMEPEPEERLSEELLPSLRELNTRIEYMQEEIGKCAGMLTTLPPDILIFL